MQIPHITANELQKIAWIMVDQHGDHAAELAGVALAEMREQGDERRSHAWAVLQSVINDALHGKLPRVRNVTVH